MKNNKKEVVFEFSLPEFKQEDIKVKLTKNSVAVRADRKIEKEVKRKDFFHKEKSQSGFNYVTTTPPIDPNKAKISFTKGVLKVKVPKV